MHKFCNTFIPVGKSCNPVDRALHMRWNQYLHLKYKQDWSYIFDLTNPRFANPQPVLCCFLPVATSCICTLATDDLQTHSQQPLLLSHPSIDSITQCWAELPVTLWCILWEQNWGLQMTFPIAVLQLQHSTWRLSLTSAFISKMLNTWLIINSFLWGPSQAGEVIGSEAFSRRSHLMLNLLQR